MKAMAKAAQRAVTLVLASTMVCVGPDVRADGPPGAVDLAWVRAEGAQSCPDGATLESDVTQRLGRNPFVSGASQRIEGVVSRHEARWVARVYVRDGAGVLVGSREITSDAPGCASISNAIALAIALTIDSDAALRAPPPPTRQPNSSTVTLVGTVPVSAQASVQPTCSHAPGVRLRSSAFREYGGGVSLRAVGLAGILPRVAPGAALAADGHIRGPLRWSFGALISAESHLIPPNRITTFNLAGVWLAGCFSWWPHPRTAIHGCAGSLLSVIHGYSNLPLRFESSNLVWGGPLLELRVMVPIVGPLIAELGVQGAVAVTNSRFSFVGRFGELIPSFQPSSVAGLAYVGLGVQSF